MNDKCYTLEVSGRLACFTRPEMKVERVSYDVIPPSAARAIFEAIYWKPQIRWRMERIEVMSPICFTHIRRCEVSSLAHARKSQIITNEHRQLRSTLALRDVCYRLSATMEVFEQEYIKHQAIFERRARKGQCFTEPYLGCREFTARWRWLEEPDQKRPISESKDLGIMLYDIDYPNPHYPQSKFFHALMKQGVIECSSLNSI